MTESPNYSNLELVARVDAWPCYQKDPDAYREHMKNYWYFMIEGFPRPFGYMHISAVQKITWDKHWDINTKTRFLTFQGGATFSERCERMAAILLANPSAFGVWADELFPIYDEKGDHILDLDSAGVDTLGIVNYSCHLIAHVKTDDGLRYWVPRRAKTKLNFPDMLDNTVGGSLTSGEQPLNCIVRKCAEKAGIPKEYTRTVIKACGTLSYQMTRTDDGRQGCQHQVQYVYEMEIPGGIMLVPGDGEVQGFHLMALEEVVAALRAGEFKPNCGMTWMAFLIRNGHVNAENEKNLVEIGARLHRKHDLFIV